jgi:type 2 lantibiotic biosynthesis protein LanM
MDPFFDRLIVRAATVDERLSDEFEILPGQKGDADLAAKRLAAWCRSSASGDWALFARRLARDRLAIDQVLARFATVRRSAESPRPAWIDDAIWISSALQSARQDFPTSAAARFAFEDLFIPVVELAAARLWPAAEPPAARNLATSARTCLRNFLLEELCNLCAPALYERFTKARQTRAVPADASQLGQAGATALYDQFITEMKADGFRRLFEDKPVLLRLMASLTRQWLATTREFVTRLDADLPAIRRHILRSSADLRVVKIQDKLSDPHHGGRSVLFVEFEDGARIVYKPKDLRLDALWHALIKRMNQSGAPITLQAVRTIARDGYGWTEHIAHAGCPDTQGCKRFFQRAGAWLALFHCFAASDMHQENMIAAGEHPVPIDLETILQAEDAPATADAEAQAFAAAKDIIANSVMAIGLLPAYGKSVDNDVFVVGGVASDWTARTKLAWTNVNADTMRPTTVEDAGKPTANLPHVEGRYAKLGDHIDDLIAGFAAYAKFLHAQSRGENEGGLFDGVAGLPVRKVVRPTQFYYLLLHRLRNDRSMDDGVLWSAQADFQARLADWETDADPVWPLQRTERAALVALNVPHFVMPSHGTAISDTPDIAVRMAAISGLERARARVRNLDEREIAWQIEVIRQNTRFVSGSVGATSSAVEPRPLLPSDRAIAATAATFRAEADRIADEVSHHAIRRGSGAAWIGLGWAGDSEVSQLAVLGSDLYNGACGIALFLAAHATATQRASSAELALAAVAQLRKDLKSRSAARLARSLGIGGATGLGSIVYALAVLSKLLDDDGLLADAHAAAELFNDDLIAADRRLDVIGGSAGAILSLLRLYRDTQSHDVLQRARKCGEHLMAQPRVGPEGRRSWRGPGPHFHVLNGMSHGAAGFAYALAALAAATNRQEFAAAAWECIAFENSSYDRGRANWPDFREAEPHWRSQWCHGAVGIGLARLATTKQQQMDFDFIATDVGHALAGAERGWPNHVDTLCCGALGSVEFLCEAGRALQRSDLCETASRRLAAVLQSAASTGDYRWNGSVRRFNLGLFRGLAGVGYTCLRQIAPSLPNVLIWE